MAGTYNLSTDPFTSFYPTHHNGFYVFAAVSYPTAFACIGRPTFPVQHLCLCPVSYHSLSLITYILHTV